MAPKMKWSAGAGLALILTAGMAQAGPPASVRPNGAAYNAAEVTLTLPPRFTCAEQEFMMLMSAGDTVFYS